VSVCVVVYVCVDVDGWFAYVGVDVYMDMNVDVGVDVYVDVCM